MLRQRLVRPLRFDWATSIDQNKNKIKGRPASPKANHNPKKRIQKKKDIKKKKFKREKIQRRSTLSKDAVALDRINWIRYVIELNTSNFSWDTFYRSLLGFT